MSDDWVSVRTITDVVEELVQIRSDTYFVKRDITKTTVICGSLKRITAWLVHNRALCESRKSERETI
jgi:hypothetical protein